ncbi:MAG: cobalamin B12-binding domain-containing protein [Desulfuromonadaceae bacterium]
MGNDLDELITRAQQLPQIPFEDIKAYHEHIPELCAAVDTELDKRDDILRLIGNNPLEVMYENHKHHAAFMTSVFSTANYELLARTLPWVYQVYSSKKFLFDYFPLELNAWIRAIQNMLSPEAAEKICAVYTWMLEQHHTVINIACSSDYSTPPPLEPEWLAQKNAFLNALLAGDHRKCVSLAEAQVKTSADLNVFYLNIVQPCMYEVGILWERGFISVAQEHLTSSIVGRVLAQASMIDINAPPLKARAIVSAAPNELHEIGAWMVSDILEHDGWQVRYLGANTPTEDLIKMLKTFKPHILALSVTMPFNLHKAKESIQQIRAEDELKDVFIIVGGNAFRQSQDLWQSCGADAWAANVHDLRNITAGFTAA